VEGDKVKEREKERREYCRERRREKDECKRDRM